MNLQQSINEAKEEFDNASLAEFFKDDGLDMQSFYKQFLEQQIIKAVNTALAAVTLQEMTGNVGEEDFTKFVQDTVNMGYNKAVEEQNQLISKYLHE